LELEVRALTELWVELAGIKRAAKNTRTTTNDPLANETHRVLRRYTEGLATRIHEKGYGRRAFWKAVLRVAERILKDLHTLAKSQTPRSPDT
jgi:hypothetical protein